MAISDSAKGRASDGARSSAGGDSSPMRYLPPYEISTNIRNTGLILTPSVFGCYHPLGPCRLLCLDEVRIILWLEGVGNVGSIGGRGSRVIGFTCGLSRNGLSV